MEKVNSDLPFERGFLTTKEAAKYLRIHPLTMNRLAKKGVPGGVRVGWHWKFHKETLERWIKNKSK